MSTDRSRGAARRARRLDLTEALVARVERTGRDPGPRPGLTPMTEDDFAAAAARLCADIDGQPFWLFAYGSLIWKPAFDAVEARRAVARGWRRSFCLNLTRWRATPEEPGLMLALDRGGACAGVAYRLGDADRPGQMLRLLKRETGHHEDLGWVRWLSCSGGGERFRALCFYAAPRADDDLLRLPENEQARRLARAAGHQGSCAMYLWNTVRHLEELGIRDGYLWRMQRLVAAEIAALPDDFPARSAGQQ